MPLLLVSQSVTHISDLAARIELTTSPSSMAFHWTGPNVSSYLAGTGFLSSVQTAGDTASSNAPPCCFLKSGSASSLYIPGSLSVTLSSTLP